MTDTDKSSIITLSTLLILRIDSIGGKILVHELIWHVGFNGLPWFIGRSNCKREAKTYC